MADLTPRPEPRSELEMRASDSDRERVAEIVRQAAGDGRLDIHEVDERLRQVYAARTYAELEPVTRDLPASFSAAPVHTLNPVPPEKGTAVAVLGSFSRKGSWLVPRRLRCLAFWGGGELDLREARLPTEVTIRAFAVMGGINVTVPEYAEVHVTGVGIMGGFDQSASGAGQPGAPRVIVRGLAFWGGVNVERKPRKGELKQLGR